MGQEQSNTGGVIHAVVGSGAAVDAEERKAIEEDEALIAEVNSLPLPPPASTKSTSVSAAPGTGAGGEPDRTGEETKEGGNDGADDGTDTESDRLQLMSALGALAKKTSAMSVGSPEANRDSAEIEVELLAKVTSGQQEVKALIDASLRKALVLQGKLDSTRGYSKEFGRLADNVDQLAMHTDENIDNIKAAVEKADALGEKHFEKDHELHSFKNFLRANPINPPARRSDN